MNDPEADRPELTSAEKAHAALIARLSHLYRNPVKPPKSLQPTPEAAKSRVRRLRHKQRLLVQRSKQSSPPQKEPRGS